MIFDEWRLEEYRRALKIVVRAQVLSNVVRAIWSGFQGCNLVQQALAVLYAVCCSALYPSISTFSPCVN